VRKALQRVIDPELGASIVDLNMVRQVTVTDRKVNIQLVLTAPVCPLADWIVQQVRQVVNALRGVEQVEVEVLDEPWRPPTDDWQSWLANIRRR